MNDQLWGSGGQSSSSHELKDRFFGLAEASFSTSLGGVGFLFVYTLLKLQATTVCLSVRLSVCHVSVHTLTECRTMSRSVGSS